MASEIQLFTLCLTNGLKAIQNDLQTLGASIDEGYSVIACAAGVGVLHYTLIKPGKEEAAKVADVVHEFSDRMLRRSV
jgi:hypothetical protein